MSYEPTPEILALIDHAPIHEAMAEINEAQRRYREAVHAILSAEAEMEEAHAALPVLTDRAVSGERISSATLARAHARIRDADRYQAFVSSVALRLQPDQREADARLSAARAQAYRKVLDRAIDLQIAAAERADRAGGTPDRLPDMPALAAAKRDFEAASAVVLFAIQSGAKHPGATYRPTWPTTASFVRQIWARVEATQEAA